jgi:MmgE/PrpD C-terminal domain
MRLVAEHHIDVQAIESVHVGMPANALRVVDNRQMHHICVQDMVSAALVRGGLSLSESPFPGILGDPAFARMRARMTVGVDAGLEHDQPNGRGANVTISTTDGSTVSRRVDHPRGHSLRGPVTWSDLSEKWHDALPGVDVDRMLSLSGSMTSKTSTNFRQRSPTVGRRPATTTCADLSDRLGGGRKGEGCLESRWPRSQASLSQKFGRLRHVPKSGLSAELLAPVIRPQLRRWRSAWRSDVRIV